MTKRVTALLLTVLLVLGAMPTALADSQTAVELRGDKAGSSTTVTALIKDGAGITNGKLQVTYNPSAVTLAGVEPGSDRWVCSVHDDEAGTVSFAWVGSSLSAEETVAVFTFIDRAEAQVSGVEYAAECSELYTGTQSVTATGTTLWVSYGEQTNPGTPGGGVGGGVGGGTTKPDPTEPEPTEPTFVDVAGHWAEAEIEKIHAAGLVSGTGDGTTFEPNTKLTRAMFATVLFRSQKDAEVGESTGFTDVEDGTWYSAAASWGEKSGVIKGVGDGTRFAPEQLISREQLMTMLLRYAQLNGLDTGKRAGLDAFSDAGAVSGFAQEAMQWAVAEGILIGNQGKLRPQGDATRGEMATILCRFFGF